MLFKKFPKGTKKSGWRVRLPTTCQARERSFPHRNRIRGEEHRLPTRAGQVPTVLLSRKRAAAATVARRIGILENETLAHERFLVLECGAVQVQKTLRVNEEARAKFLEDLVAVARLGIQLHGIGETGTAATLHANAQAADIGRHAFHFKQRADFLRGAFGKVDFRDARTCDFCCHDQMLQKNLSTFTRAKQGRSPPRQAPASAKLAGCGLSATPFRGPGLRRRAFSSSRRWRP